MSPRSRRGTAGRLGASRFEVAAGQARHGAQVEGLVVGRGGPSGEDAHGLSEVACGLLRLALHEFEFAQDGGRCCVVAAVGAAAQVPEPQEEIDALVFGADLLGLQVAGAGVVEFQAAQVRVARVDVGHGGLEALEAGYQFAVFLGIGQVWADAVLARVHQERQVVEHWFVAITVLGRFEFEERRVFGVEGDLAIGLFEFGRRADVAREYLGGLLERDFAEVGLDFGAVGALQETVEVDAEGIVVVEAEQEDVVGRLVVHEPDGHVGEDRCEGLEGAEEDLAGHAAERHPYDDGALVGQVVAAELEVLDVVEIGVRLVAQVGAVGGNDVVARVGEAQIGARVVDDDAIARVAGVVQNAVVRGLQIGRGLEDGVADFDAVDALEFGVEGVGVGRAARSEADGEGRFRVFEHQHGQVGEALLVGQENPVGAGDAHVVYVDRAVADGVLDHGDRCQRSFAIVDDLAQRVLDFLERVASAHLHEDDGEGERGEGDGDVARRFASTRGIEEKDRAADGDVDEAEDEEAVGEAEEGHQNEAGGEGADDGAEGVGGVEAARAATDLAQAAHADARGHGKCHAHEERGKANGGEGAREDVDDGVQPIEISRVGHGCADADERDEAHEHDERERAGEADEELDETVEAQGAAIAPDDARHDGAARRQADQEDREHGAERVGGVLQELEAEDQRAGPEDLIGESDETGDAVGDEDEARHGGRDVGRGVFVGGLGLLRFRVLVCRGLGAAFEPQGDEHGDDGDGDVGHGGQKDGAADAEAGDQKEAGEERADDGAEGVDGVERAYASAHGAGPSHEESRQQRQRGAHARGGTSRTMKERTKRRRLRPRNEASPPDAS